MGHLGQCGICEARWCLLMGDVIFLCFMDIVLVEGTAGRHDISFELELV